MESWINRIHELSIQQLEELIRELGPIAVLQKELNAKILMHRMEGLPRSLALLLIDSRPDQIRTPQVDQLEVVLAKNRFTETELANLKSFCNEGGSVLLQRAVSKYMKNPVREGMHRAAQEILGRASQRANKKGDAFTAEDAQRGFEEDVEDFGEEAERLRLRDFLRDEYGIESKEDFLRLVQAVKMIEQTRPDLLQRHDLKSRNIAIKLARALYEEATAKGTTPKAIIEWRKLRQQKLNPNVIYTRPDGQQIWGTGEAVIRDKDGHPRRKAVTIFGTEVPSSEVPDMGDVARDVWKAYPDQ